MAEFSQDCGSTDEYLLEYLFENYSGNVPLRVWPDETLNVKIYASQDGKIFEPPMAAVLEAFGEYGNVHGMRYEDDPNKSYDLMVLLTNDFDELVEPLSGLMKPLVTREKLEKIVNEANSVTGNTLNFRGYDKDDYVTFSVLLIDVRREPRNDIRSDVQAAVTYALIPSQRFALNVLDDGMALLSPDASDLQRQAAELYFSSDIPPGMTKTEVMSFLCRE